MHYRFRVRLLPAAADAENAELVSIRFYCLSVFYG